MLSGIVDEADEPMCVPERPEVFDPDAAAANPADAADTGSLGILT